MRWLSTLVLWVGVAGAQPVIAPLMDAADLDPAPDLIRVELRAEQDPQTGRYFYNGQSPGPVIRGRVGDTLVVELTNALDSPTTIHWHGIEVPNAMDGAPWVQPPTPPGERFEYRFELRHAGTFWYHPHFDTERQVDAGLYGLVIVEAPDEPIVEELLLVFDADAEFNAEIDALPPNDPGRPSHGHGGRAHLWRINGTQAPAAWTGRGGQTVRVRMLNVSNTGYVALRWPGLRQIAGDQGLLAAASTPDQVVLSPGDRGEFEWQLGMNGFTVERLPYSINGGRTWQDPVPFIEVQVDAPAAAPAPVQWPFDGAAPSSDPGHADLIYTFHGSDRIGLWLINGERMPDITIETVQRDTRPIVEVRNISASHHPFHVHGMRFEVLSINGEPVRERRIEDTIDVGIRQRIRMALHPREPGDWMLHCHILPHADDGMMTVLRVQ